MRNLPAHMARWSARHPWRAVSGWLVFVVLCLAVGIAVGTDQATTVDFRVGGAGRAEAMTAEVGLEREPTEHAVIHAESGPLDEVAARTAAEDVTERMRALARGAGRGRARALLRRADAAGLRRPGGARARGQGKRRTAARTDRAGGRRPPGPARRGDGIRGPGRAGLGDRGPGHRGLGARRDRLDRDPVPGETDSFSPPGHRQPSWWWRSRCAAPCRPRWVRIGRRAARERVRPARPENGRVFKALLRPARNAS